MNVAGALLLGLWGSALQAGELRQERWPDGKLKLEYEVERLPSGEEARSGSFRSFYPSGNKQAEGRFAEDHESGRWQFFFDSGAPEAEGSFAKGKRTGLWKTFHPNGKRSSMGNYAKGVREGEWLFWSADGSKDTVNSGVYAGLVSTPRDRRMYRGELLDGLRHGPWTSYWPNLEPQLEASFVRGKRHGQWVFRHEDGSISTTILSGIYADDRWASPLPAEVVGSPSLRKTPPPEPAPSIFAPIEEAEWKERIRDCVALGDKEAKEREETFQGWHPMIDIAALPFVVAHMLELDPEKHEDRRALARLDALMLNPICRGQGLGPLGQMGLPDVASARERVRAWASVWALTRSDPWLWQVELDLGPPPETLAAGRHWLQEPEVFECPERDPPALFALRSEGRKNLRLQSGAAAEQALVAALEWLKAHQSTDGIWNTNYFESECGKLGAGTCGGHGNHFDVGVTALALLAFLGDGSTIDRGPYQDVVSRGITALLQLQDQKTSWLRSTWGSKAKDGQYTEHWHGAWLHEHGLATAALCEALATHESRALRTRTEKAVRVIVEAQNTYSGWRYAFPPDGDNDSAMTGEMLFTLRLAREVRVEADSATATSWGLNLIDELTDPATGRTGYESMGDFPARLSMSIARLFPPEQSESMTALAVCARIFGGRTFESDPMLSKGVELLVRRLPSWEPDHGTIDLYYWLFGTLAMQQVGGSLAQQWDEALRSALCAHQCVDRSRDDFGSWDPIDAWSSLGGRVYSTAMAALCLEAGFRYASLLTPTKDKGARPRAKK